MTNAKPTKSDGRTGKDLGATVRTWTILKKAGGSLIMTVPAAARDALHLSEGQEMSVSVEGEKLVLETAKPARPKYTLDELLAECDFDTPYSDEERAWIDAPPMGRELL